MRIAILPAVASLGLLALAGPTHAYVDWAPTLGKLMKDASNIVVVKVEKVSQEKRVIIYGKVADLKGKSGAAEIKHHIAAGLHPREPATIMDWAEPGQTAILFQNGGSVVVCIGRYWYEGVAQEAPWWSMTS